MLSIKKISNWIKMNKLAKIIESTVVLTPVVVPMVYPIVAQAEDYSKNLNPEVAKLFNKVIKEGVQHASYKDSHFMHKSFAKQTPSFDVFVYDRKPYGPSENDSIEIREENIISSLPLPTFSKQRYFLDKGLDGDVDKYYSNEPEDNKVNPKVQKEFKDLVNYLNKN